MGHGYLPRDCMRGPKRAAVKEQAEKRDAELSKLQSKAKEKADKEIQLDDSGQVKGVLCRLKKEKSGTMNPRSVSSASSADSRLRDCNPAGGAILSYQIGPATQQPPGIFWAKYNIRGH